MATLTASKGGGTWDDDDTMALRWWAGWVVLLLTPSSLSWSSSSDEDDVKAGGSWKADHPVEEDALLFTGFGRQRLLPGRSVSRSLIASSASISPSAQRCTASWQW